MTKKKINFKPALEVRLDFEKEIDKWVRGESSTETNAKKIAETKVKEITEADVKEIIIENNTKNEEFYRLSLDIPKYLHRRIKKTCVLEDTSMRVKLTELLFDAFPGPRK
jgi:hypothetical protein